MRFNNVNAKILVALIYFFLSITLIIMIFYLFAVNKNFKLAKMWHYILFFLVSVFFYLKAKFFEFDSDGNGLTFINRGFIISNFINYREKKVEFLKSDLISYKIRNYFFFSTIYIYIKAKRGRIKRLNFGIIFLSNKKRRAMKRSLDKVIQSHN